jgi:hypothetical protein
VLSSPGQWRHYLFCVSAPSVFSLMNCLNLPLPFAGQAGLVALWLGAMLAYGVPATSCALQHPQARLQREATAVCDATLGSIARATQLAAPVWVSSADLPLCQSPQASLALCTFFTLYLGAAVPLCVSRHYEQWLKRKYLAGVVARARPPGAAGGGGADVGGLVARLVMWMPVCCATAELLIGASLFDVRRCNWYGQS